MPSVPPAAYSTRQPFVAAVASGEQGNTADANPTPVDYEMLNLMRDQMHPMKEYLKILGSRLTFAKAEAGLM